MKYEVNPEISKWLLNQPWTGKFIDNLIKENEPEDTLLVLLGGDGPGTIDFAFRWEDTPEGWDFWGEKNSQLIDLWRTNKWGESTVFIEI